MPVAKGLKSRLEEALSDSLPVLSAYLATAGIQPAPLEVVCSPSPAHSGTYKILVYKDDVAITMLYSTEDPEGTNLSFLFLGGSQESALWVDAISQILMVVINELQPDSISAAHSSSNRFLDVIQANMGVNVK